MTGSNTSSSSRLSALAPPFSFKSSFLLDNYNFEQVYDDGYYVNSRYDHLQTLDADSTANPMLATQPHATHDASAAIAASMSYNNFLTQDECIPSHSSDYNSSPTRIMTVSGANKIVSLLKPGFPEKMDSHGDDTVIDNENYSGKLLETVESCGDATTNMEPCVLLNARGKVVCHKKVEMIKRKEEKNGEYVNNGAIDPLVITKNELLITSEIPDLVSHGSDSGVPVHNSSELLDQNDSDVDSPCWKGTGVSHSTFGVTRTVGSQFPKIETEARKTLNPLAPHFFPGSAIPRVEYHENTCNGNDYFSNLDTRPSVAALSSKQHNLNFSLKAGTYPTEVSNVIETQTSNSIHEGGKEYTLTNKANGCSVNNSSLGDQPWLMEDHFTSNGQDVMVPIVVGSANGIVDNILNGSSSLTFGVTGNLLTSSFSRNGVSSDVDVTLLGASKSTPPKLDVQLVINTMHDLSELLKWNYSNDLDSISKHDHDMIQHIINNLYVCMTNEVGQRVSIPESSHPCTSYSPRKLSGRHKVTRMKAMTVSTSPMNNHRIKKGDEYTEIIEKALKENHQNKEEMCTPSFVV